MTRIKGKVPIENAVIFKLEFNAASRGADVQWISQFPYEKELLYPPFTYLTFEGEEIYSESPAKGIRLIKLGASVCTATNFPGVEKFNDVDSKYKPVSGKVVVKPIKHH